MLVNMLKKKSMRMGKTLLPKRKHKMLIDRIFKQLFPFYDIFKCLLFVGFHY